MARINLGQLVERQFRIPGNAASYRVEDGQIQLLREYFWEAGWSHVRRGRFHRDKGSFFAFDLLFYNRSSGKARFYAMNGDGSLTLWREYAWEPGWTHVVPGNFQAGELTDVLLYNQNTGAARLYAVQDEAVLEPLGQFGWRRGWSHVVAGNFNRDYLSQPLEDLLFCDQSSREAHFYSTDGAGNISFVRQNQWQRNWVHIVPGQFGGSAGFSDLLFYDGGNRLEVYNTQRGASMSLLQRYTDWEPGWTHLVPFKIGGAGRTDLLFYKMGSGKAAFYTNAVQGNPDTQTGDLRLLRQHRWRAGWRQIVPNYMAYQGNVSVEMIFYRDYIFPPRPRPQG